MILAVLCALSAAAFSAADAHAAAVWLDPLNLRPAEPTITPDIAMNASGDIAATWVTVSGVVQAAVRPAGGNFGPIADLTAAGATNAHVAIDGSGGAVVVWEIPATSSPATVQASIHPPGGPFGPTQNLSVVGEDAREPQVAMDPAGNAVATWLKGGTVVQAAARAAGGSFFGPFTLTVMTPVAEQAQQAPQVAMDRQGNAVVVWTNTDLRVRASMRRAGASFAGASFAGAAHVFQGGMGVQGAKVAMTSSGEAVAIWQTVTGGGSSTINSSTSVGGAPFSTGALVSPMGQALTNPTVGVSASGEAIAVWQRTVSPGNFSVQSAIRLGGAWQTRADLPNVGSIPQSPRPQIAMNPAGDTIVTWFGTTGVNAIVQALNRPAGGSFGSTPTNVSVAGVDARPPRTGIDDDGDGVAIWVRGGTAQLAGYDAAAPQLRGFSGPGSAVEDTSTAWSVTPVDVWSGVVFTRWSFSDGAISDGASANHTFVNPGSYAATFVARDALGNERSNTAGIAVSQIVVPIDLDRDRDGYVVRPTGPDCNDENPAIHPGALDPPGNKVDEDCDGVDDPYPFLPSQISLTTQRRPPSRSLLLKVLVIRQAVAGSTLRLSCSGRVPCRNFKTVTRKIAKSGRRTFSSLLPKRLLRPGAKFEMRVTKPGFVGRVQRLTIFSKKRASIVDLCLNPKKTKPAVCNAAVAAS